MTIIEPVVCVMRAPAAGGVSCAGVPRWSHSAPAHQADYDNAPAHTHPVFLHDDQVNSRFAIWQGDISSLEADAITNTTDETLTECNAVNERILQVAGPELKEEIITRGFECRTGEVIVTHGFGLRCRHIIHTVSPKYVAKYHTAADTSLHNCYRNVLCKASEIGARTLALCLISTPHTQFPPDLAAHVALRTIRRHLEQHRLPQLVILASSCGPDVALLSALAPLYFPRSAREADAARWRLPDEPALHDRRIRIIHNPHSHNSDTAEDDTSTYDEEAAVEAAAAFARACAPDTQRLLAPNNARPPYERRPRIDNHDQYERLLRRARTEDLSEISGIGCLYQSGVDRLGRPVVVFIGKWFPIGDIDLDKALLYLIKLLDPIVRGDYVIAYFHTLASSGNHPPFSWLKEVYTVLPYKYKKNLKAFYIVHPTFWTKMMTWWFTTFMAPAIKAKVHNLPGVEYLYSVMARDQLDVPAFVTEYDMTINGLHYFQPDTNNTYERLLRRARTEDLREISDIGCLYQSGVDRLGRPVVVFINKWFPIGDIDLDKALLYLIKLLDPIVRGDYVIAYFHTLASSGNHPPFSWLMEVYTVLPYKYKKNLKAFYIVHPTFWTKMMTQWFTTFMAPAIKAKVHNLLGVEYLYSVMAHDQLDAPAFVTEYDMTINGLHYFQPDTNNT